MTKREKTIRDLRNKIARMEAQREAAIKTLVRVETTLPKLGNQLRRLTARDRKLMEKEVALGYVATRQAVEKTVTEVLAPLKEADTRADVEENEGIPEFLRRASETLAPEVAKAAHEVANNHNKVASPEAKKLVAQEKRRVEEEHKHALLTGAKRKWPATGKDASRLLK